MNCLTIIVCHFLLIGIVLALPANKLENKSHHNLTSTTVAKDLKTGKKDTSTKTNNKLEKLKSPAKKRDVPLELPNQQEELDKENPEDFFGGKSVEEYEKVLALRPSSDNARIENSILKAESYGDPASMNEYRYYGGEDRKKRTAIYNHPSAYSKRELSLTPDDVMALLSLIQQQQQPQEWQQQQQQQLQPQLYYPPYQSRWSDLTNSLDFQENDIDDEDVGFNESPENRFDDLYSRERFPHWGNFAKDKRFMVSKRNSFLGKPKLAVPIYRRAIL